jgi:hypothetical protein
MTSPFTTNWVFAATWTVQETQRSTILQFLCLPSRCLAADFSFSAIFKPIWTYGIQLWGTTSNQNIEILERFQSKILRLIVDAPWYVSNSVIRKDLQIPTVKEKNQPLQLPLRCPPPCTHQWTYCHTHRAANRQASAPILAQRPAYQI